MKAVRQPARENIELVRFAGVEVFLARLRLHRGDQWTSRSAPGLWCSIILQGSIDVSEDAFGARTWSGGSSFRHFSESARDIAHSADASRDLVGVFVHVPPDHEEFWGASAPEKDGSRSAIWDGDPFITALGWQMMACPLSERSRELYLAGKALELLAFMACRGGAQRAVPSPTGRTHEIERLYEARSRLLSDLKNQPTVPELARSVGLNPRRLGELFKTHFG
ncbi:MAG TPA: hypothetical protein VGC51_11390, partial [Hansschlegelia sp.]